MKRSSSTRLRRAPTPPTEISSTGIGRLHLPGRPLDGLDDVLVTGAAAEVPRDRPADLFLCRVGVVLQERGDRQHHPRSAEPALQPVLLLEPFLDRMELARPAQPFHRGDLVAIGLHAEEGAGLHRKTVEQHGAGPAAGCIAAEVRPGETEHLPDHVNAQRARLDLDEAGFAVDRDFDLPDFHQCLLYLQTREPTSSKRRWRMSMVSRPIAFCRARTTNVCTRCFLYSALPRWSVCGFATS